MKTKRELAYAVLSFLLIAFALTACQPSDGGSSQAYTPQDEAWVQAYYDVQKSNRPGKTYQAIDYTRSLYFDGFASLEQTQQRIHMILQVSPALRLRPSQVNTFITLATDSRPYYRNLKARDLRRRYIH